MIEKFFKKFRLKDEIVYCFQIDEDNIVTNVTVFNEKNYGGTVEEWIKETGERWFVSDVIVGGQYYPFYGDSFTAEIKPIFKKPELWYMDVEKREWLPIDYPRPDDEKFYVFCEDCLKWLEQKCC